MGCLSAVLVAGVASGPAGSLCLGSTIYFSSLLSPHLFFKLAWPATVLLTGLACSSAKEVHQTWGLEHNQGRESWGWTVE